MRPSGLPFSSRNPIKTLFPMLFFLISPPSVASAKDHGGQGDLSSFAGTSSKERVEWVVRVGPENVALSHYRTGNKGLWEKPQHES